MSAAQQNTLSASAPQGGKNRRAGKAVMAGVVAVGLLAAGGGTFAKWSDNADAMASTKISTGKLSLEQASGPAWTFGDSGEAYDPATDKLVPGDTVKFATAAKVNAAGKNLDADLSLQYAGNTKAYLDSAEKAGVIDYTVAMSGATDADGDGTYDVTEANDGDTVTVTGEFTWLGDSTNNTDYQNLNVTFDGIKLLLEQK